MRLWVQKRFRHAAAASLAALGLLGCSEQQNDLIFKTVDGHCFYITPEADRWHDVKKFTNQLYGQTRGGGHLYLMRRDDSNAETEYSLSIQKSQNFESPVQAKKHISNLNLKKCQYEPAFGDFVKLLRTESDRWCNQGDSERRASFYLNVESETPFRGVCGSNEMYHCSGTLYRQIDSASIELRVSFFKNNIEHFPDIIAKITKFSATNIKHLPDCKLIK